MADDDFIHDAMKAPRLTSLAPFFRDTARGIRNAPLLDYARGDPDLLSSDPRIATFHSHYVERMWVFERHFASSVPYILENECRYGAGTLRYAESRHGSPLRTFHIGSSEGPLARTLGFLGCGQVLSLAHSDTPEHGIGFHKLGSPPHAVFRAQPLFSITPESIRQDAGLRPFWDGFDLIFEHQTFQFYGADRRNQIRFMSQLLRDRSSGIMVMTEKLANLDEMEYRRREKQKDLQFKSRFFVESQIEEKREEVLRIMRTCEVTLEALTDAIRESFAFAVLIWNSGNFSSIAASNSSENLASFIRLMGPPLIPPAYCYDIVPRLIVTPLELPAWGAAAPGRASFG